MVFSWFLLCTLADNSTAFDKSSGSNGTDSSTPTGANDTDAYHARWSNNSGNQSDENTEMQDDTRTESQGNSTNAAGDPCE